MYTWHPLLLIRNVLIECGLSQSHILAFCIISGEDEEAIVLAPFVDFHPQATFHLQRGKSETHYVLTRIVAVRNPYCNVNMLNAYQSGKASSDVIVAASSVTRSVVAAVFALPVL